MELGEPLDVLPADDFSQVEWGEVRTLVHLGFARPHHGQKALNESLEYSAKLMGYAAKHGVHSIVFISSRAVYGVSETLPVNEDTPSNPNSPYGVAKRAVELVVSGLEDAYPHIRTTIVRLGAVNGGGMGNSDVSAVSKFVKAALAGEQISIIGGDQTTDLLHIEDAVEALVLLIRCPPKERDRVYVVSSPQAYKILDLGRDSLELANNPQSKLLVLPSQNLPSFAMDPSRFSTQFGWSIKNGPKEILQSLLDQMSNNQ
jgi:nucleoside-diphosphate-sugar epimerase